VTLTFSIDNPSPDPSPVTPADGGVVVSPPAHIQQFGIPSSGDCADGVVDPHVDWSQKWVGGWSKSWSQWIYGGTGGAVCTRMIIPHGSNNYEVESLVYP